MSEPADGVPETLHAPILDRVRGEPQDTERSTRRTTAGELLLAGTLYLLAAVLLWWHVWSGHPSSTTLCGCGDPALFTWFMEWPAYAIAHGHSLFYSSALFHPTGINLLANTSVLALGVPLAPVTWVFGPVASLNVALTLTPALNALAAYWALKRWARWPLAAFAGGLLFGFSPFVLQNLAYAHLQMAMLAVLPLVLAGLDELFVRQRHRAVPVGLALGSLVAVQFFVGTEMLVVMALSIVLGVAILAAWGLIADRGGMVARARRAMPGVAAAIGVSVVLLGYPAWFALDGPAHLSGLVWPTMTLLAGAGFGDLVALHPANIAGFASIGGYFGTLFPAASYLGWGVLVLVAFGLVCWRRERLLWFFSLLGAAATLLALPAAGGGWSPWRLLDRLPLLDDVNQEHFAAVASLASAVLVTVVVDLVRRSPRLARWAADRRDRQAQHSSAKWLPSVAAGVTAVVALGPVAAVLAPALPYTVRALDVPPWFAQRSSKLVPRQVLLAYPAPFSGIQSALTWQATSGIPYAQVGGSGPESTPSRAGAERPAVQALTDLAFLDPSAVLADPAAPSAIRSALHAWEVTTVVVPTRRDLPLVVSGQDSRVAAAYMTDVIGRAPVFTDGAWVWSGHLLSRPALDLSAAALQDCVAQAEKPGETMRALPACVLGAAARRSSSRT
ncbi:MAG: hypothetical protein M0Z95_02845 [Actinomycetota bacterium]|nr:hypothetical protein [Actinomycetota bacterium]